MYHDANRPILIEGDQLPVRLGRSPTTEDYQLIGWRTI